MLSNVFGSVTSGDIVAFCGIVSTGLLGWFGYKRAKRADTVTEKAGAVEQIIDGLNTLVSNLQDDNKVLRDNVKELRDALIQTTKERDNLKRQVKSLQKKYGQADK